MTVYFYPRSPRGERQDRCRRHRVRQTISIHAPREGSDLPKTTKPLASNISIHAPREGSDAKGLSLHCNSNNFYPRSPRGERLRQLPLSIGAHAYFYPRSPRGERLDEQVLDALDRKISIHAPREGSDSRKFAAPLEITISIHAPREGSDLVDVPAILAKDISIHAPREGSDPARGGRAVKIAIFLSTLPARGATYRQL